MDQDLTIGERYAGLLSKALMGCTACGRHRCKLHEGNRKAAVFVIRDLIQELIDQHDLNVYGDPLLVERELWETESTK